MEPHGHGWSNSWTKGGPVTGAVLGPETLRNLMDGRGVLISAPCRRSAPHRPAQGAPQLSHMPNAIRSARDGVVVDSGMYVLVTATSMNTVGSACMSCWVKPWQLLQYLVRNAFPKFAYVNCGGSQ